jgi:molecular chaperone HscB
MNHDPFQTLGVPRRFRLEMKQLEQRHRDLSRALHPDRFAQASPAERRLAIEKAAAVNDAFRTLRQPQSRAAALLATAGRVIEEHARAEPALLLEVMALREELEEARDAKDATTVEQLRATVAARIAAEEDAIAAAFDGADAPPSAAALDRAHAALVKLRYFYRFLEEAEAMGEE